MERQNLDDARTPLSARVIAVIHQVLGQAGLLPADLSLIIHGTTLATNAIIERKGARTALVTTEGFRDTIEIRHENRFEQYDVNIDLPPPLVPRRLRFPVRERDRRARPGAGAARRERRWPTLAGRLAEHRVEAVAIGFLHSFTNPAHERRAARNPGRVTCRMSRSPCRATCRRRCANTSAFRPPAPMPMSSR